MKAELKKYQKLLEIQIQRNEYEKFKGFSGEKRLFKRDEDDDFLELDESGEWSFKSRSHFS